MAGTRKGPVRRLTCHDAPVVRYRTGLAGVSMALAMLTAGACQHVSMVAPDRHLVCGATPQEICGLFAELTARAWERQDPAGSRITEITVMPHDCGPVKADAAMARCWWIDAHTARGTSSDGGYSGIVYQRPDGTYVGTDGSPVGR